MSPEGSDDRTFARLDAPPLRPALPNPIRLSLRRLALWLSLLLLTACTSASMPLPDWYDTIQRLQLRSVVVDDHRLAYLDEGDGPPLLLLHGFGGAVWQWEYQLPALSATHRVIALDLVGSGLSDKPDIAYRADEFLRSVTGFLDALHIERATVIGNSMGGGIALGLALTAPQRVDRLVLIGGLPPNVQGTLTSPLIRRALETKAPTWLVRFAGWLAGSAASDRVLEEIVYDHRLLTAAVRERSQRNRRKGGIIGPALATARTLPIWESDYAPRLSTITHRTLVLWGEQDRVFPPAVGRDLAAQLPQAQFFAIPQAGHIPQWEQPQVVNRAIAHFLSRP